MLIKLSNTFEKFVTDEIEVYKEKGEERLLLLRTFYQKVCVEPNQKVDSLRFILAVRYIELITEHLDDAYPIDELATLIQEMRDNNMYVKEGKKVKYKDVSKVPKAAPLIEEVASIGFNKRKVK